MRELFASMVAFIDEIRDIKEIVLSNQEKIDALTYSLNAYEQRVRKIEAEVRLLKETPAAENLNWSGVDSAMAALLTGLSTVDDINPDH